jgi:hypothetical protein
MSNYTSSTVTVPYNTVSGTAGSYLINTGTVTGTVTSTTASWAGMNSNFSSTNGTAVMTIPFGEEKVRIEPTATLEVKGNIVMNGMDLDERLKTIEKVLCIPERDVIMETKHPKLADLYKEYMHELEKYRTWERIKGDDTTT